MSWQDDVMIEQEKWGALTWMEGSRVEGGAWRRNIR